MRSWSSSTNATISVLLRALPPGLFPRHGGGRVQQFEPARVVLTHPAHELVEDVVPVNPEGENGPAQRRPVVEDVIGLVPPLCCQTDALGSGHLRRGRHLRRAGHRHGSRILARLRGRRSRFWLRHLPGLVAISVSFTVVGYVFRQGMTPLLRLQTPLSAGSRPSWIALRTSGSRACSGQRIAGRSW